MMSGTRTLSRWKDNNSRDLRLDAFQEWGATIYIIDPASRLS